jgi:predicted HTH transcriptional regulator
MLKDHGGVLIQLSEMGDFFRVELLRSSVGSDGEKKTRLQEKYPALQQTIIENMSANSDITYAQLMALTGKSQKALRCNINQLKQKVAIERIGSDKGVSSLKSLRSSVGLED